MVAQSVFSTGLMSSYCTVGEVLALLAGYDLTGLSGGATERAQALLAATRQAVDGIAGRDFRLHAEDEVRRDGSGTARLSLLEAGTVPLQGVQSIEVDGQPVAAADYAVYPQEAEVRLQAGARLGSRWPAGARNVRLVVDWGYAQPPADVALAQAKLTAAQLLAEASGEAGEVTSLRLGDWAVSYAAAGKHRVAIGALVAEAQQLLAPYRRLRLRVV